MKENKEKQGRTWYCAGPFWDQKCKEFFDEFKMRIRETTMINSKQADDQEPEVECGDSVFMPGHFEVNFPAIKKDHSVASFKRVLTQILHLDTEAGINGKNMVVYVPGYDLGTMFEVGYYIATMVPAEVTKATAYGLLRKYMILHETDEKMNEAIDKALDLLNTIAKNYVREKSESILVVDGNARQLKQGSSSFDAMAIRLDNSADQPFNALAAGMAYAFDVPFITYSLNDAKSNTMMIGASLGHVKTNNRNLDRHVQDFFNNLSKKVWTDDNINYAKDIK